jgi:hypothetical protein
MPLVIEPSRSARSKHTGGANEEVLQLDRENAEARKNGASTASSMAYLITAPAAGVITCAASPNSRSPGLYQRRQRLKATDSSASWRQPVQGLRVPGEARLQVGNRTAEQLDTCS